MPLLHVDLGEPVGTRIERALQTSGKTYRANYANLAAPFIIDGIAHSIVEAADRFVPGGWEGIFAF